MNRYACSRLLKRIRFVLIEMFHNASNEAHEPTSGYASALAMRLLWATVSIAYHVAKHALLTTSAPPFRARSYGPSRRASGVCCTMGAEALTELVQDKQEVEEPKKPRRVPQELQPPQCRWAQRSCTLRSTLLHHQGRAMWPFPGCQLDETGYSTPSQGHLRQCFRWETK